MIGEPALVRLVDGLEKDVGVEEVGIDLSRARLVLRLAKVWTVT